MEASSPSMKRGVCGIVAYLPRSPSQIGQVRTHLFHLRLDGRLGVVS